MSSRRSRQQTVAGISDEQLINLLSKLQRLLPPEFRNRRPNKVPSSKVVEETCNYIRSLHKEVDDLSERLSHLLSTLDAGTPEAAFISTLIS